MMRERPRFLKMLEAGCAVHVHAALRVRLRLNSAADLTAEGALGLQNLLRHLAPWRCPVPPWE
jgi:hypothetical protein